MGRYSFGPVTSAVTLVLFMLASVRSQSATSSANGSAPSGRATIAPGLYSYNYLGCYNETTSIENAGHVRALAEQGNMVRTPFSGFLSMGRSFCDALVPGTTWPIFTDCSYNVELQSLSLTWRTDNK